MMGCDIHAFIEVKKDDVWHYYGQAEIKRNYTLFARMANVRNYDRIEPIDDPRGLPKDTSFMTKLQCDESDGHSYSWLSFNEMLLISEHAKEPSIPRFGIWVFGNDFIDFSKYPEEYPIDDIRLVFWFDN